MSIRLEDGWYIDENNNKWFGCYTPEEVEAYSHTLSNCVNCVNCADCTNCTECADCTKCSNCTKCIGCTKCSNCTKCIGCTACGYCISCTDCSHCNCCACCDCCDCCTACNDCSKCAECSYCAGYTVNPQRIYGWTMGSRYAIPRVYWIKAGEEQCVVGCFRGTLQELEAKVKETHKDNPKHLHDYLRFIKAVRAYQEACNDTDVL